MEYINFEHNTVAAELVRQTYDTPPLAFVHSYGCQQNVNDGERIKGVLVDIGYGLCDKPEDADLILFNTCAVREHAEQRVFGNVGALKGLKEKKPGLIIGLCGCMANQKHVVEKLRKSYPYVDLVFGVDGIDTLPQLIAQKLQKHKRVLLDPAQRPVIVENIPIRRESEFRAWLPIMYGCDNFCTYCIVPYVRGRERSREPEQIVREVRELVAAGYKEITLLGQNVNSYGKDLGTGYDFADLLAEIDRIDGDYWVRFMSSQPKDATPKLFDTMAASRHVTHQLHLPVQSGNDRVLRAMNRPYTRAGYLELIRYARRVMPDLVLTSDIIIGFPGETEAEAMDTVSLINEVHFDALFTFIFSPRPGTPAAKLDDPTPREEKQKWFDALCNAQNAISAEKHAAYIGRTVRVLVEGESDDADWPLSARTEGNRLVRMKGDKSLIGTFTTAKISGSQHLGALRSRGGNDMKITTLLENKTTCDALRCEHGLSLYIETAKHKILFDSGASDAFWKTPSARHRPRTGRYRLSLPRAQRPLRRPADLPAGQPHREGLSSEGGLR